MFTVEKPKNREKEVGNGSFSEIYPFEIIIIGDRLIKLSACNSIALDALKAIF